MSKKQEVVDALDTVIKKGDDFLVKAKDFITCVESLVVTATALKEMNINLMTIYENILVTMLIGSWSCLGASLLISSIQSIIYDRRKEKRELEYHNERMKSLK